MNLAALEAEIVKDLNAAPAIAKEVSDFIASVKGSPVEALLEKVWPGIANVETEALAALGKLSSLSSSAIAWLNVLLPKS